MSSLPVLGPLCTCLWLSVSAAMTLAAAGAALTGLVLLATVAYFAYLVVKHRVLAGRREPGSVTVAFFHPYCNAGECFCFR